MCEKRPRESGRIRSYSKTLALLLSACRESVGCSAYYTCDINLGYGIPLSKRLKTNQEDLRGIGTRDQSLSDGLLRVY